MKSTRVFSLILIVVYNLSFLLILLFLFVNYFSHLGFIEGLQNNNYILSIDLAKDFCRSYTGAELENKCHGFTKKKCQTTDCCYWNGLNERCVAGDKNGPLFQ
jgi:hypothetical protein